MVFKKQLSPKKSIIVLVLILMIGSFNTSFASQNASEAKAIIQSEKPEIEVVFVLDTTGSMSGLIAAAKEKIWSIANTLSSTDPVPKIKMGLVGYRDRGDSYITAFTPLSDDIDSVYSRLMEFQAGGGGDTPESVNQAIHEAVTKTLWSNNKKTYKVIFLVGDAPPHMDYQNDVSFKTSCSIAAQKGIIINTIQCGNLHDTEPFWRKIAQITEGDFFRVAQSGNAVLHKTPYDKEIAHLSQDLDTTRVYYGDADKKNESKKREQAAKDIYSKAKPSAIARRSIFNAGKAGLKNFLGSNELVDSIENKKVTLEEIKEEELPENMKKMSKKEREEYVKHQGEKRKKLKADIAVLAKKRQAHIEDIVAKEKDKGKSSLDSQIYKCIKGQAASKEIIYDDGPEY